ncbi:MAG: FG-GAP repeat protein [Acidimicrobiales bacterium]|jgi:hypothetical protein
MRKSRIASLSVLVAVVATPLASAAPAEGASPRTTPPIGTKLAILKGYGATEFDRFGSSAAISGTTLVVGADGVDDAAGRAYVFARKKGRWKREATLTPL